MGMGNQEQKRAPGYESSRWTGVFVVLLLTLASIAVILPGMSGSALLTQGDEAMHIQTVRESMKQGSYLVPRLQGGPNYYKPPLLFWMSMGAQAIFGPGLAANRLPSLLAGLATVLLLFFLLREARMSLLDSLLISLFYLFSMAVFKFGRLLMMEQAMAAAFMAVVLLFARYIHTRRLSYLLLAGFVSGLGFWLKGPLFQFYSGLFLLAWAGLMLFRFRAGVPGDAQPRLRWLGRRRIGEVFRVLLIFHLASLVPVLAWPVYLFSTQGGADIFWFFAVIENLGKFSQENQSEFRILGGWLLYTFPWTIVFIYALFRALRHKIKNRADQLGRILAVTVLMATVFHFLPNRKDAYYVIPFVAPAFAGVSLLLRSDSISSAIRLNLMFLGVVSLLFILLVALLGASPAAVFLPALALLAALLSLVFWKRIDDDFYRLRYSFATAGILALLAFQFSILPVLHLPRIPALAEAKLGERLCVVSDEPWDAMDFAGQMPGRDIRHSVPGSPTNCMDGKRDVLLFRTGVRARAPQPYQLSGSWEVWKRNLEFNDIIKNLGKPGKLMEKVYHYAIPN